MKPAERRGVPRAAEWTPSVAPETTRPRKPPGRQGPSGPARKRRAGYVSVVSSGGDRLDVLKVLRGALDEEVDDLALRLDAEVHRLLDVGHGLLDHRLHLVDIGRRLLLRVVALERGLDAGERLLDELGAPLGDSLREVEEDPLRGDDGLEVRLLERDERVEVELRGERAVVGGFGHQ